MILVKFRVTEFRSVEDSGWIDAEKITTLIGTNESGKTNILLPLWKLNPADSGNIDLKADLPREKYHLYRKAQTKPIFIRADYELTEKEKVDFVEIIGSDLSCPNVVEISRDFDGNYYYGFPGYTIEASVTSEDLSTLIERYINDLKGAPDAAKAETKRREDIIGLMERAQAEISNCNDINSAIAQAIKALTSKEFSVQNSSSLIKLSELIEILKEDEKKITIRPLPEREEVISFIRKSMPKYVYYSNYGNLDSQIYLPHVVENIGRSGLGEKEAAKVRTLKTLFKYVGLDPKEILHLGVEGTNKNTEQDLKNIAERKAEREILLSSASAGFTKAFNEWWKQGNYNFEFTADGNFFRIWVSDAIRPEKIELEARSTGLQWFFSFYLVFLVESDLHHQNAILLLDEPGITLHPNAQKDLFKFFESLADKNQMIYTTHSPFMVDSDHLERVRSVYINRSGKTVCSSDLRASEKEHGKNQSQSIYPAHAALGLSVSSTLLVNCIPVLVEGESDQLYLSGLKNLLISLNRISPLKDIVFIPTGGVKGIKAVVGILSGRRDERPFVIVDGDKPGQKMKIDLCTDFYADCKDRVIDISDFSDVPNGEIEDLFPGDKFSKVVTSFLPRPEDVEEEFEDIYQKGTPMCDQIESFAKEQQIHLERGWKVKLASKVKAEILKGKGRIITDSDPEFPKVEQLFSRICK